MEHVIYLKFTQHKVLKKQLVDTGDAKLIEVRVIENCDHSIGVADEPDSDVYRIRARTMISGATGLMVMGGMSLVRR